MQILCCLSAIMDGCELSAGARQELDEAGFTVIPGQVPTEDLVHLVAAYDAAITGAAPDDVRVGSSTTRVRDFVNRGPEFVGLYIELVSEILSPEAGLLLRVTMYDAGVRIG